MEETFTIAELSARAGVPVTALRMYQQRKLLSPPQRRGRIGYYNSSHVERLRLIAKLQDRGYSLAAIADVLGRPGNLALLLDEGVPSLAPEQAITLTLPELIQRLPAADFSFDMVRRAQELGLLEIHAEQITVAQPTFLDVGSALVEMGVPGSVVLDAYERLRIQLAQVADDFVAIYDTHLAGVDPSANIGADIGADPAADIVRAGEQLDVLSSAAVEVVVSELRRALRRVAADRIAELEQRPTPH